MFLNYLTIAYRNIINHPLYSIINIGGLAVGLAACMLILLFIQDELSYDKWIPNAERIYKFETTHSPPNRESMTYWGNPGMLAESLAKDFAEIEQAIKVRPAIMPVRLGDKLFNEQIAITDANFFDVFDYPVVAGLREEALQNNTSVLISERIATKYFGDNNPLGQILNIDNEIDYKVVGVIKDLPENSHMRLDFLVWFDPARYVDKNWFTTCWFCANLQTYIKLAPGADIEKLKADLPDFAQRNVIDNGSTLDERVWDSWQYYPRPLLDVHLYSKLGSYSKESGDIMTVITFSAVAVLILIIAGINFMNLATARSMQRAREVSIRKVMGATRAQLVKQFLGEAVFTAFSGLILAILLAQFSLPYFNEFLQKDLVLNLFSDPLQASGIIGFTLFVGILGGTYPAFFISNFRPSTVLRSNKSSQEGSAWLRNALVVLQFAISIVLIVTTSIIYAQTIFARNMDMGFSTENRLTLKVGHPDAMKVALSLKQELLSLPGITDAAMSNDSFPKGFTQSFDVKAEGMKDTVLINSMVTGPNFFQLYGVNALAGRLFSKDRLSDHFISAEEGNGQNTASAIVNESFLQKTGMGSPEEAIGKVFVNHPGEEWETVFTIVGVVPDLNVRSIYNAITPTVYSIDKEDFRVMTLTLSSNNMSETLAQIDAKWKEMVSTVPINREFVEDKFNGFYNAAEQKAKMFAGFSLFAIFVSCLGLYGLASFAAERRTKEIGLRKVLGANVTDIVKLLIWQFSYPVLWANIIAWPVAWYFMNDWLKGFEYRITMNPLPFVVAGGVALLIAWGTVAHRAAKVARTSPIKALKYE
jgi:putative ABC transport system permease protein